VSSPGRANSPTGRENGVEDLTWSDQLDQLLFFVKTLTWARKLGPYGITVNLVASGWIPVERHAGVPEEVMAAYAAQTALRRFGRPADVAATVAFLASPAAAFITGERIAVNGGHTLA
jgi:3-oxoacyl-[acyl-carrier protein] reductase